MSRKEKMKVYHGIPLSYNLESVSDVYVDFSKGLYGKGVHKVVDVRNGNTTSMSYVDGITGSSAKFTKSTASNTFWHALYFNKTFNIEEGVSISAIIKTKDIGAYFSGLYAIHILDFSQPVTSYNKKNVHRFLGIDKGLTSNTNRLSCCAYKEDIVVSGGVLTIEVPNDTYVQYQFIIKDMVSYYYINEKLVYTQDLKQFDLDVKTFNSIQFAFPIDVKGEFYIEQLAISTNTDIIPNCIPQDYTEGKAIIKERLGQQQIKGDPLISQTTELIVDSSSKLPKPYSNEVNADGTYTHLYKPELSVLNANLWNNTSKLKIKGLNGEIISGVIDSDTSFTKVTGQYGFGSMGASPLILEDIQVEDTSKIVVNDTLAIMDLNRNVLYPNYTFTVTKKTSSAITLQVTGSGTLSVNIQPGYTLLETTASSSAPTVKTTEGTTVVGTWTGLGTSEATFTLGTNTGLTGKDLVVTYSLNMPPGNSQFPELPSDIERAYTETGIEMKPVNEIVIEDDFRGKLQRDTLLCPHKTLYKNATSLTIPSQFTAECTQKAITNLTTLDGTTCSVTTSVNLNIPQLLFSINLIEMVERKLGCEIPSRDKIQWIYDNVTVNYECHAIGTCPSGNYVQVNVYKEVNGWVDTVSNSTSSTLKMVWSNIIYDGRVDSDGFIHFLVSGKPSDGVTASTISVDYFKVILSLKTDSTFTTLYCDNKRAREDSCNPVLIQKETKTVKRYIPSKECFVTESKYFNPISSKGDITLINNNPQILTSQQGNSLLTYGTGSSHEGNYQLKGSIARLKPEKPSYLYLGEILKVNNTFLDGAIPMRYLSRQGEGMSYADNFGEVLVDTSKYLANNMLLTRCKLSNMNGEVKMLVYMADILNKKFVGESLKIFTLPNRPLIK